MTRNRQGAFTLSELIVSIAVLVGLVLLVSRLFNSVTAVTTLRQKRMDAESQIRPLFGRMAVDFAQMIKRPDVDYFLKAPGNTQSGNDQIGFFGVVPGYYPSTGSRSPVSVVAYRINSIAASPNFRKLERMAKGLLWNGVSGGQAPILFAPIPLASPSSLPTAPATPTPAFPTAGNSDPDSDYELIGPYVFRFEYYYVLRNGLLSAQPWDDSMGHTSVNGLQDASAIAVCIAIIDPKSRVLISNDQLATLTQRLIDFPDSSPSTHPGDLLNRWQTDLDATTEVPRSVVSSVRIYERYFYLLPQS